MAAIENLRLPASTPADLWPAFALQVAGWLASRRVVVRDAVVLLPFAALVPPARAAFAAAGGWLPRIETPLTLAASLAPPPAPPPDGPSGDPVLDRLRATVLLRRHSWAVERERHDRRAFAHLVDSLVDAAQALREAALARAPSARAAFFADARERLPAAGGPGAFEALLLRVALEWAAEGAVAATDVLFEHRPAAWVALRLGGSDELADAVLAAAGATPALRVDADADADTDAAPALPPQRWLCDDLEQAAQSAAAQVIQALDAGRAPVALVALDRQLARRVRALLDRQAVPLIDETGWALSTTRAAARLMSLLQAALPTASADAHLDWLKTWPPASRQAAALQALEARWRGARRTVDAEAADALWAAGQTQLQPFTASRERTLAGWLALLREGLSADGSLEALRADAAGQQALQALRLDAPGAAWQVAAGQMSLDLAGFTAWVDATLEAAQFLPPPTPGALVVLTPLARAIGRPFGQIVAPGADHRHLGAIEPAPSLLGEALAEALGLDSAARRRARQRLAFAQLLRAGAVSLIRRRRDGDEPLAPSPEVEAGVLAGAARGRPWPAEREWRPEWRDVAAVPMSRPAPGAADDLPARLSASSVEALRDCPYRFFARAVLRLSEDDELDAGLEKRDYGTWLHAVLHHFHRHRNGPDDAAALAAAADAATLELRLDAAELLPYRASFESFAPAYLDWLAGRDAEGWRWEAGEADRAVAPPALAPQQLAGRLDRLDRGPAGALQVIDYKTGSLQGLRARVASPLEDTQLAFYAALEPAATTAIYLALDDPKAPVAVEHPEVADSAAALVDGLAGELARLRAGAGLPALGEGRVCETCEARGLCRRDDWAEDGPTAGPTHDRARLPHRRARGRARGLLRRRLRPAPQRRRRGLRRRRQDLDAGLAHPARAAGRRRAAADPGHHLHAQGRWRDARAARRMAGRLCRADGQRGRTRRRSAPAWPVGRRRRGARPRAGRLARPAAAGGAHGRAAHLPRLVRPARRARAADVAGADRAAAACRAGRRPRRAARRAVPPLPPRGAGRPRLAGRLPGSGARAPARQPAAMAGRRLAARHRAGMRHRRRHAGRLRAAAERTVAGMHRPGRRARTAAARAAARRARRAGTRARRDRPREDRRGRDPTARRAGRGRPGARVRAGLGGLVHRQGRAAQAARRPAGAGRCRRRAATRARHAAAAGRAPRPRAHGAAGARAAGRVRRAQARARPGRHGRPRARRAGPARRHGGRRLGPAAAGPAAAPCADRRVPGHQPAPMAGAARLAVVLCRRRRGRQRTAAAVGVHRRRSQAEHLPLPPRRAARLRGRARIRHRGPGRPGARMRPHPAQRQRRAGGAEHGLRRCGAR